MIYLQPNQPNTIVVTWSQRATLTTGNYLLVARRIETNTETLVVVPKATNTSAYARYDRFTIQANFAPGSYDYTVYEASGTTLASSVGVVESGLMQVKMAEAVWINPNNSIQYSVYQARIFSNTFDQTFN